MRKWIRKLIIWAIGYEPIETYPWKYVVQDEGGIHTLLIKSPYDRPPTAFRRPIIEAGPYNPNQMPEPCRMETLVRTSVSDENRFAVYRVIAR